MLGPREPGSPTKQVERGCQFWLIVPGEDFYVILGFLMIFYEILLIFIDFLLNSHVFLKVFCLRSIEYHRNVIEKYVSK